MIILILLALSGSHLLILWICPGPSNYQGNSESFTTDNPDLRTGSLGQDFASSIRVVGGAIATLFQHINYGGRSEIFTHDDPDLTNNIIGNDTVSSLKLTAGEQLTVKPGDLIKNSEDTVYYYGIDGKRHAFPARNIYDSWYQDFGLVKFVTDQQLSQISLGKNVTSKPGVRLIKLLTDPKVYAVDLHGTLRWITNEDVAKTLYGDNWQSLIDDLSDAFFVDYTIGDSINNASDFNPILVTASATSIDVDLNLTAVANASIVLITNSQNTVLVSNSLAVAQQAETTTKSCQKNLPFVSFLKIGQTSLEVKDLQELLQCLNYLPADVVVNGHFVTATETAVKKFQLANNLDPKGYVGPGTRAVLNTY
ncbi:MAG: peptidoglycan-binding protein [Candidatus Parcubacteria bacterium]|nr:peptidoglycan-binding protein [Candidatus Parcubacteria bacterium]